MHAIFRQLHVLYLRHFVLVHATHAEIHDFKVLIQYVREDAWWVAIFYSDGTWAFLSSEDMLHYWWKMLYCALGFCKVAACNAACEVESTMYHPSYATDTFGTHYNAFKDTFAGEWVL